MDRCWTPPSRDFRYLGKCSRLSTSNRKWFEENKIEKVKILKRSLPGRAYM